MNRKERTILVTIIINLLLVAFKFWLAGSSGSLALRASAVHSVADLTISAFVLLGLFISRWEKARNEEAQQISIVENWVALVVAAAIFYVGFDIIREVLGGEAPELRNLGPITFAAFITVVVAFVLARYKLYVGRQTDSPALIAGGYHSRMDIYASIVVVASLAGAALGLPGLDRTAAAIVVVFILFSGYEIANSAIHALRHRHTLNIESEHVHPSSGALRLQRSFSPAVIAVLLGMYLLSGFYTVQPGEVAIIRRFGQVINSGFLPGLHYRLPWPVDRVDIVATDAIRRVETNESLMVTGDENLISVRVSLHFSVSDPVAFLLNVAEPEMLVNQAAEAAIRQVVAQEGVDALLTLDKEEVQQRAAELAQSVLDSYNAGLRVVGLQLLASDPPPEVAEAFRDVASAREDRNTFINEALAYTNEVLPLARGTAATTVQDANAYYAEQIGLANGEASLFASQQGAYADAPDITRLRLYLEAVENALPGARKFIVDAAIRIETTDLWIPGQNGTQIFPPSP